MNTLMQIIRILQGGAQAYSVEELFLLAQPHSTWCHELKKRTIREEEVKQGTLTAGLLRRKIYLHYLQINREQK